MKLLFACIPILTAAAALAQEPVRIDLSGEWKMIAREDRPEFAGPEFDDSAWKPIRLPTGRDDLFRLGDLWLRRRVAVPAAAFQRPLAITVGTIRGSYEVYFNGRRIAANGSRDSFAGIPVPSALTFPLPAGAVETASLTIAIRINHGLTLHRVVRLPDEGPWLITDLGLAPAAARDRAFEKRRAQHVPLLIFAAVFFCFAVLSLLAWRSEPQRSELGWLSLLCFSRTVANVMLTAYLFPPVYPFNPAGAPLLQYAPQVLQQPLLGELVIAALGYRQGWLRVVLWLAWTPMIVSMFVDQSLWWPRDVMRLGPSHFSGILVALLAIVLVIRDWWWLRRKAASLDEHALRFVLLVPGLSIFERSLSEGLGWDRDQAGRLFPEAFTRGPYTIERIDLFWLIVAAMLIGLLLRRVAADRAERQRLAQELEAAGQVQRLLVSGRSLTASDLEMTAHYLPAQEVGGDFYHVLDGRLLVVGDVSGKGLKAAMLVSLVVGVLRDTAERAPGAVLAALNRALAGHIEGFVTCCCAHFGADGVVTMANAGHLPPYVDGVEAEVEGGLPLGVAADAEYGETRLTLAPGSSMVLLSDGVVEAANGQDELFGFERTRGISTKSAPEIAEAARAWGQNDDITVVTVRRTGA